MKPIQFIIFKEKRSEYGDNRTRYYSIADGHDAYFDYGKSPLAEAKKYAKKNGFSEMVVKSMSLKVRDRTYKL